jgi:hypothetical protein
MNSIRTAIIVSVVFYICFPRSAHAEGPPDAATERRAAAAAEQRQDWDAALQHYENVYDATATNDGQRKTLRAKFSELRPRVRPNNDPAQAGVWKLQVYVVRTLDFAWQDAAGKSRHSVQTYSDEEVEQFRRDLAAFSERVWQYTAGNLRIAGELKVVEQTLTRLDGRNEFWPGPDACMPLLTDVRPGEVDTIMVFVKTSGPQEPSDPIPLALLGGALGASPFTKDATYIGYNWGAGACDDEPRGEAMLHEWLHSAQWALDDYQGYPAGLMATSDGGRMEGEAGGDLCYRRNAGESSWMNFYQHIMRDHVTRRMWRELSVTTPPQNVWANQFCREFLVLGPLAAAGKPHGGLDEPFLDETRPSLNLKAQIDGCSWQAVASPGRSLDLIKMLGDKNDHVAYVAVTVSASKQQRAQLRIGSDDGCKVWHNGKLILASLEPRALTIDQDVVDIQLTPGANLFLIKVANVGGGWETAVRLTDSSGAPLPGVQHVAPKPTATK